MRKHNSPELTNSGQAILATVSGGLDRISDALNAFNGPAEAPVIACSGTNAASTYWLKPYMDRLCTLHPEVRFVLLASDEDDTLRNFDEVDVSFICGNERCDIGETLHYLFPEIVEPVCSPDYLSRHGPFKSPAALADAELLTLHQKHWSSEAIGWFPFTWNDWFSANGAEGPEVLPRMVRNSYPILIEAALAGQGFVLGWHHIVKSPVAHGRLIMPFNAPLRVDRGNYLKVNKSSLGKPVVQEFIEFIQADVASIGQGSASAPAEPVDGERKAQR